MTNNERTAQMLFWNAITPIHSGTGQASAGVIDLPIAREVATNFPMLPASSIKGVLRGGDGLGIDEKDTITQGDRLYGYTNKKTGEKDDQGNDKRESRASQLTFTDARLLALPVRSYKGTFAYVTCPLVIQRLARDLAALGFALELPDLPTDIDEDTAHLSGKALVYNGNVLFEDIDLKAVDCGTAVKLAETLARWTGLGSELTERLAVVSNDVFTYFAETAMDVSAHIALENESKTVRDGALWYEEALPAASILSSFVLMERGVSSPITDGQLLQIGGKASVGRGLLQLKVAEMTERR